MELRYYQDNGIIQCANEFAGGLKSIVYQLSTGGGKTVIFCEITNRYITKNIDKAVVIVVHRRELLIQTRLKLFEEYEISATEIVAGMKNIPKNKVYICMVESLHKRIKGLPEVGLLILDECHIAVHNKIIDKLNPPLMIGFSATPISSNKKEPLNKRYQNIVVGPSISTLIKEGHLCQNLTYAPKESVDRTNLLMKGDDFDELEMAKEFSKPKFVINTVDAYRKWCMGTKTIVFNVNIDHSKLVEQEFKRNGFNVRHLASDCSDEERVATLRWFKETKDAIICNVGILTTGFDEPTVESIIVNKSTNSLSLWIQMTGRGGRPSPFKSMFTIIDMGGNAVTHGDWCDERDWKFIFEHPTKKSKNSVSPCKMCPQCEAIVHAAAIRCKYCNFIFPSKKESVEELLNDYVLLTKNIDVQKVIDDHSNKKQYYTFFSIVREHARIFRRTKKELNNEVFEFILENCMLDCKKWCHLNDKRFNKFHQTMCRQELQTVLRYEYRVLQEGNQPQA